MDGISGPVIPVSKRQSFTRRREKVPMQHEKLSRKERQQGARLRFVQAPFHGFRVARRDMRYCYGKTCWVALPIHPSYGTILRLAYPVGPFFFFTFFDFKKCGFACKLSKVRVCRKTLETAIACYTLGAIRLCIAVPFWPGPLPFGGYYRQFRRV
jgi:hypothetical protein